MTEPLITGSFFDMIHVNPWDAQYWTDTCRFWGEESWRSLFRQMHAVGIDTAICGATVYWGRPTFPGYEKTVGRQIRMGCSDPLGACVDEADRLGMKMFFGIGLRGRCSQVRDYYHLQKPWPDSWFRYNTRVAEALVDRYGKRPCFGGLYISYEIDFHDHHVELYERLMKKFMRPAVGDVPFLASPGNIGREVHDLSSLSRKVERTGIDILAPQDYGGRNNDPNEALKLVEQNCKGLKHVAKSLRDMGVTLWANCEAFKFKGLPDGRGACIPGQSERFIKQIEMQAQLVDKLLCYQYQGLFNRRTKLVDIGHPTVDKMHDDYVAYLTKTFPERFRNE